MRKLILLVVAILLTMAGVAQAAPEGQDILPRPQILTFTTSATMVDRTQLNNRTARVPVSWTTDSRPASANLVFEQVLPDGRVVNVELPRQNPYVSSNGDGIAAPFPPGGSATSILLRVRLIDMVKITVYDEKTITLNIGDSPIPTPTIVTFSTSATTVGRNALNNRSARVPVSWVVDARPANSNLVFEQVLANGTSVNVELPRQNPIVSSSGIGVAAPVWPGGTAASSIQLRLRVIDLASQRTLAQKDLTLNIAENDFPTITAFSTTITSVSRAALNNRSARIPVSWSVTNRPANSNLVFEQVLDNGTVINVELPRQNPYVASEGVGVASPANPGTGTTVKLQLRLIDLGTQAELAKRELSVSITEAGTPKITLFTTTSASVDNGGLTTRTARVPVSWNVDNRPDGSNLVFEQVLANGTSVNVELPRPNPYVSSSGNGVVAPMPPGGTSNVVQIRLRLVNLSTGATLDSKDITIPITGRPNETVWEKIADPALCYSNGFPAGTGIVVSGRGRVVQNIPNGRLTVADKSNAGLIVGELLAGETFAVQSGPDCYKVSGGGLAKPIYLRLWHVSSEAKPVQGWISEYVMDSATSAITVNIEPQGAPSNAPQIVTFTANPTSASPGQQVTLTWEVANATSISFAQLPASVNQSLATQLSGTTQFVVPSNSTGTITVELTAANAAGQETRATVSISIVGLPAEATEEAQDQQVCPFNTSLADSCPVTQESVSASYQPFERGLMVWNGSTGVIYVLYSDGSWQEYPDTWAGEPDITVEGEQPPEGMSIPQRGFGKVWLQVGGQGTFGWATAIEAPYQATWETHALTDADQTVNTPHFTLPDGRVVHLGIIWSIS